MDYSIVIPTFNNITLTKNCIESVIKTATGHSMDYEIIVVDDCSLDSTQAEIQILSEKYPVIRHFRNPQRSGFARSCNRGAEIANSPLIIFLNNDTLVKANWDVHLINTIANDPDAGIVGAKLLFGSNTIQHAGICFRLKSIIIPDHIYTRFPSYFPLSNIPKELQSVTGACFIIRREHFEEMGGFDEEFINGGEDIDLCFRIRDRGKKILYQPLSEIIHLEARSYGRNNFWFRNFKRIKRKWGGNILPDENTIIKKDLSVAMETGMIKQEKLFITKDHAIIESNDPTDNSNKGKDYTLIIDHSSSTSCNEFEIPEFNQDRFYILVMKYQIPARKPKITFVAPTIMSNEVILHQREQKWKTQGTYYLLYNFPGRILKGTLRLETANISTSLKINSISLYSYIHEVPVTTPTINLVMEMPEKESTIQTTINELASVLKCYRVNLIILHPEKTTVDKYECPDNLTIVFVKSPVFSSSAINDVNRKFHSDYIFVIPFYLGLNGDFLIDAISTLELHPHLGFSFTDIEDQCGESAQNISFKLSPLSETMTSHFDIPCVFRKNCWEETEGFNPEHEVFRHWSAILKILTNNQWIGYKSEFSLNTTSNYINPKDQPSIDFWELRREILSQYADFLLNENDKLFRRIQTDEKIKMIGDNRSSRKQESRSNSNLMNILNYIRSALKSRDL